MFLISAPAFIILPFKLRPLAHLSSKTRRAFAPNSFGAVALSFKKTKLILATAYLAEKLSKSLVVIRRTFFTLFPFNQLLSNGAGTEEVLSPRRRKNKTKIYQMLHKNLVRSKLKIN